MFYRLVVLIFLYVNLFERQNEREIKRETDYSSAEPLPMAWAASCGRQKPGIWVSHMDDGGPST